MDKRQKRAKTSVNLCWHGQAARAHLMFLVTGQCDRRGEEKRGEGSTGRGSGGVRLIQTLSRVQYGGEQGVYVCTVCVGCVCVCVLSVCVCVCLWGVI